MKLINIVKKILNESSLEANIESKIESEIKKLKLDNTLIKFIDKDKKVKYLKIDEFGNISDEEINESLKDKLTVGAVCIMLASGMVSCKKSGDGFGYNVNAKPTIYNDITAGNKNKQINIYKPDGKQHQYSVDSTLATKKNSGPASTFVVGRRVTPTEGLIIRLAYLKDKEAQFNNGRGAPENYRVDFPVEDTDFYANAAGSLSGPTHDNIRKHDYWKKGLQAAREMGYDVNDLIRKADKELENGEFVQ